jgi:hypothetical protein
MDRTIVYPLQVPLETDMLNANRDAMIAVGGILQGTFGLGTSVFGLAATPVSPSGMGVTIGIGGIITESVVDANAYSSLGTNSNVLMKMGMNYAPVTLPLTAPTTAGYSQVYLVQVEFVEADGSPNILPYINPSNIAQALAGPAGNDAEQNTRRTQSAVLSLVAGTPAATGSQVAPAASPGCVGLYAVTVANGQSTIVSSNIAIAPNAPFLPNNLAGLRQPVYGQQLNLYVSPSGSDTNPGTSAQYPFQTINAALASAAQNYDFANASVTINLAAGNYAGCEVNGAAISTPVKILGNTASPNTVTITGTGADCVWSINGASVSITGVTCIMGSTSSQGIACLHAQGGTIGIGPGVVLGSSAGYHIACQTGGFIGVALGATSYKVTGSALAHWYCDSNGIIGTFGVTLTLTGTPNFSVAFADVSGGELQCYGMTFSGSATGIRYSVGNYGIIITNGGGASYLPGSTAGTQAVNGTYN